MMSSDKIMDKLDLTKKPESEQKDEDLANRV